MAKMKMIDCSAELSVYRTKWTPMTAGWRQERVSCQYMRSISRWPGESPVLELARGISFPFASFALGKRPGELQGEVRDDHCS